MRFLGVESLLLLVFLPSLVLLVLALVDLVRRPNQAWVNSGHNQLIWALIVIFVWLIGPLLYLAIARPALNDAGHSFHANGEVS